MTGLLTPRARLDALQYSLIQLAWRRSLGQDGLSRVEGIVKRVCEGRWPEVLRESARLFTLDADLNAGVRPASGESDDALERLAVSTALLSAYVQINFTGPTFPSKAVELYSDRCDEETLNATSLRRLSLAGEPAYHLAKGATYLLLALQLLKVPLEGEPTPPGPDVTELLPTTAWWRLRARVLQHRLVDERVPLPSFIRDGVATLGTRLGEISRGGVGSDTDLDRDLLPMLTLELGLAEVIVGDDKAANSLFAQAVREAHLQCQC